MVERLRRTLLLLLAVLSLSGCRAVATVFEAGMWVGVVLVVIVGAVVFFIASKLRGRRRRL